VGYARLGVLDKAIEYFQKAIELYPEKFYAKAEQNLIAANVDLHNYHKNH
jgi:tetratricopeptide (TPR) repeat protein